MFIAEDRHGSAGPSKSTNDLLHHLVSRVEDLTTLVARVVAMLANEQDSIDGKLPYVIQEGICDGAGDVYLELAAHITGQVVVGSLIDTEGMDEMSRNMQLAITDVTLEETSREVVRV
jgi:hypothetical protein